MQRRASKFDVRVSKIFEKLEHSLSLKRMSAMMILIAVSDLRRIDAKNTQQPIRMRKTEFGLLPLGFGRRYELLPPMEFNVRASKIFERLG